MRSHKFLLSAAAALIMIAAAAVGAMFAFKDDQEETKTLPAYEDSYDSENDDEEWDSTIVENGVRYRLDPDIETVLFLGVDDGGEKSELIAGSGGRADTILLLILDDSKKSMKVLSVSRDTMAEVDAYKTDGSYSYSSLTHINMQYAYGDSPTRSAYLMKKTVSKLLYGIRIDGFFSLTAKGIRKAVDLMGGLEITMPDDYTEIDPRYEKGAKLKLSGEDTERLLRFRDISVAGSNESRVERHLKLIESVFTGLGGRIGGKNLKKLMDLAGDEAATDLDAETLKKLSDYSLEERMYTLPGSVVEGEDHDEFHVDEEALRKLISGLYYRPEED